MSIRSRAGVLGLLICAGLVGYYVGSNTRGLRVTAPPARFQEVIKSLRASFGRTELRLLRPLADSGSPEAGYWLSEMYEHGSGVRPNMKTALDLLEKSAEEGFVPAQSRIGDLYLHGDETQRDFGAAKRWLSKAAVAGDAMAQCDLGEIYMLGLGSYQDTAEAYGWFDMAAGRGDALAKAFRDGLATRMSPRQLADGRARAKVIQALTWPSAG